MKIEKIAETIIAEFSGEFPVFNRDKRYVDTRDVLVRCSSFVSESKGKYSWLNDLPFSCAGVSVFSVFSDSSLHSFL